MALRRTAEGPEAEGDDTMTLPHWTDSDIATACAILRSHTVADYSAALASIRAGTGKPNMTEASLRAAFRRRKLAPPLRRLPLFL